MIDWQWLPVAGIILVSFWVLARRGYGLYIASQDRDAAISCGGCKGCPNNAKGPAIVELKPKSMDRP